MWKMFTDDVQISRNFMRSESKSPVQTRHFVLLLTAVLFVDLLHIPMHWLITYGLTNWNFHKLQDHVNTTLHIMFATVHLPVHQQMLSSCTKRALPTTFLPFPQKMYLPAAKLWVNFSKWLYWGTLSILKHTSTCLFSSKSTSWCLLP